MLNEQEGLLNAAGRFIIAERNDKVLHVIPSENERQESLTTTFTTRKSPSTLNNVNDGASIFTDALQSLHEMRNLTNEIGSSVVMQEALAVNKRLASVHERRRMCSPSNKRRRLNNNDDKNCDDEYSTVSDQASSSSSSLTIPPASSSCHNNNDTEENAVVDAVSDEERRSILSQASRMKRLSVIFREMEGLQGMLIRELQYGTEKPGAAALQDDLHS
jgi:hypothetical protein